MTEPILDLVEFFATQKSLHVEISSLENRHEVEIFHHPVLWHPDHEYTVKFRVAELGVRRKTVHFKTLEATLDFCLRFLQGYATGIIEPYLEIW